MCISKFGHAILLSSARRLDFFLFRNHNVLEDYHHFGEPALLFLSLAEANFKRSKMIHKHFKLNILVFGPTTSSVTFSYLSPWVSQGGGRGRGGGHTLSLEFWSR